VRKIYALIAIVGTCLVVASTSACSDHGSTPRSPSTSAAEATGEPNATSSETAPTVTAELDTSKYADTPCEALTGSQITELELSQQGEQNQLSSGDQSCSWKFGTQLDWSVQLAFVTPDTENGLQNEYDLHASGFFEDGYFEPTEVAGYPGVYSSPSDGRPQGVCSLAVGASSETMLTVQIIGEAGKDNCKAASTVAARALDTIKAGA